MNEEKKEPTELRFRIGIVAKVKLFFYVLTHPWDATNMLYEFAAEAARQDAKVKTEDIQ
ncbi:MAG: hypothetical protein FWD26_09455 [Treponema sp.]|nr:hypothetical protein [Treponema sp.]